VPLPEELVRVLCYLKATVTTLHVALTGP